MDKILQRKFEIDSLEARLYRLLIEGEPCLVLEYRESEDDEIHVYIIRKNEYEVREYTKDELFGGSYYYIEYSTMIGGYDLEAQDVSLLYEYCYYTSINHLGDPYFKGMALGGDYESRMSLIDYEMYNHILDVIRDAESLLSKLRYETYTLDNVCIGEVEWYSLVEIELYSRLYEDHVLCLDELYTYNRDYDYYYTHVDESIAEVMDIKDLGELAEAIYEISSAYGFSMLSKPYVVCRVLDGLEFGDGLFELDARVWDIVEMYDDLVDYWYDLNIELNGYGVDDCIIDYLPGVEPHEFRDYEMYVRRGVDVYKY